MMKKNNIVMVVCYALVGLYATMITMRTIALGERREYLLLWAAAAIVAVMIIFKVIKLLSCVAYRRQPSFWLHTTIVDLASLMYFAIYCAPAAVNQWSCILWNSPEHTYWWLAPLIALATAFVPLHNNTAS